MFISHTCFTFLTSSTFSWRRNTHTYSFPAPCWDLTRRVALSRHTMRQPGMESHIYQQIIRSACKVNKHNYPTKYILLQLLPIFIWGRCDWFGARVFTPQMPFLSGNALDFHGFATVTQLGWFAPQVAAYFYLWEICISSP